MKKYDINKLPVIDPAKCTKCDKCCMICPQTAILKANSKGCDKCIKYCMSMNVPCNPLHYIFCYEHCDACGLCVAECKTGAISWIDIKTNTNE